jgi:hypothetical protein
MRPIRAVLASVPVAAALLAAPSLAPAAIPTGSFELQFGGLQSIWMGEEGVDVGEEFCAGLADSFDSLELCDFEAFVHGRGRIFGYLEFAGWSGGLHLSLGGPIKGTQKGDDRSGLARVKLTVRLTGTASDGFVTAPTRSRLRLTGQTTAAGLATGVWEARFCVQGAGCNEEQSLVPPTLQTDGEWSLEIEITDGGEGWLGGSARVAFGNGEDCLYAVSGRYSARRDTARLRLLPTESACEGTSLRLKDVHLLAGPPDDISGSIAYRLFGFRGVTDFPDSAALSKIALRDYFVCSGAGPITASFDPAACTSTLPASRDELVMRQWMLLESLQAAPIPLDESGARFGRRDFVYLEPRAVYPMLGGVQTYSGATVTMTMIEAPPIEIEETGDSADLEP